MSIVNARGIEIVNVSKFVWENTILIFLYTSTNSQSRKYKGPQNFLKIERQFKIRKVKGIPLNMICVYTYGYRLSTASNFKKKKIGGFWQMKINYYLNSLNISIYPRQLNPNHQRCQCDAISGIGRCHIAPTSWLMVQNHYRRPLGWIAVGRGK